MTRPEIEPRTSRIPCEQSDHSATEPQCQPVTISPCFIRFIPLLLAARARTHTEPPSVTGEKSTWSDRDSNPGPLKYRVTQSTYDIRLSIIS